MSDVDFLPIKTLIKKVAAYTKKRLPNQHSENLVKFISLYYLYSNVEELESRSVADLYGAALSHWELMSQRSLHEIKIRIFNPHYEQHGWQSTHTIIEAVVDDMPFLVDSMRMEINRMGLTTHLMVHMGGMKVVRDEEGYILDVLPLDQNNPAAVIEAPIYMEIDRQTDPKVLNEIQNNLIRVLNDVHVAVSDWQQMSRRVEETITELRNYHKESSQISEAIPFLQWLLDDHFTFLGARDYEVVGDESNRSLRLVPGSGFGVLRDESHSKTYRRFVDLPEKARELALSFDLILLISKTNTRSTVHRPTYTDYIGIKRFNQAGELVGERRFIGLYTSSAYTGSPLLIPFIRQKVSSVLIRSKLPLKSHAGKDLMHILATLPRDDLFQATVDELYKISSGILYLQERRQIRLFVREDAYGRFVSCLVYVPRENFNADLVREMQEILREAFSGIEISLSTHFSSSILVRIHYVVRVDPKKLLNYDVKEIEKKLIAVGQSWRDNFREAVLEYYGEERGNYIFAKYSNAFPAGYREAFAPRNAVFDIDHIENISLNDDLGMSFYRPLGEPKDVIRFKLFRKGQTVPLSDVLPILENMGLRVIGEQPYKITIKEGQIYWVNDFSMTYTKEPKFEVEQVKIIFQQAFVKIWLAKTENDSFNRLVLEAQLSWRQIALLRAYTRYLRQIGFTFSAEYIAETLVSNASVTSLLIDLFYCCFDPKNLVENKDEEIAEIEGKILKKLDEVSSLDEDRILRRILNVIKSTLRTNYFQFDKLGQFKEHLSFKLDSAEITDVPLPVPKYEIFVYSPRFEGVHLRAGKVARGGIRWSDRREDFRTEILGLMKAQQVKNSLIVPSGAKGGFVPKFLPIDGSREDILEEGIACYRGFINGLLDLTDNLEGDTVISPSDTVCYDDADPYLVVAADKGTAAFSDIANGIAMEKNFWLGDAFASGGSTGYDHKKMGITARGAWVSARRHFQEVGINVDETEITVVGVGDMSGDVFGNGMLLSRHLKLVAAFNHQHIFLDPHPNPEQSFEERLRLFRLPRSTWADYQPHLISEGGGVFSRSVKSIRISPEIRQILGIEKDAMLPNELIQAILRAPIDLIWNGGIGTYIKSSVESDLDVGDRGNDAVRINGNEVRAKVICEGGNLGLTQLARIEYELNGGRINTDFVDNSAGVDCSDHEVNIKILLDSVVKAGDMTEKQRNNLLLKMTDEVAELVLKNNYHQNQILSFAAALSSKTLNLYSRFICAQENAGKINRALEFLPDNKIFAQRKLLGLGLTKPELAVLVAYSKIILENEIKHSDLTEEPYLSESIQVAFPTPLRKHYASYLEKHKLRSEIISTQLSNRIVSDMGVTFVHQLQDESGASISLIIKAYTAARDIFHMSGLYEDIRSLDYKVSATIQHEMTNKVIGLVRRATRWLIRNRSQGLDITTEINYFAEKVALLYRRLPKLLLGDDKIIFDETRESLKTAEVPHDIALKIASSEPMYHALNIVDAATTHDMDVNHVAKIYFILMDKLNLLWFREQINSYTEDNSWVALAKSSYKTDLDLIQQRLTIAVLQFSGDSKNGENQVNAWIEQHQMLIERWNLILTDLRAMEAKEFALITVAIRELANLAQISQREV